MAEQPTTTTTPVDDRPAHRYDAALAGEIERKWQRIWEETDAFATPNPGDPDFEPYAGRTKQYILDMFPYPSGVGLHVGHPLGYIATDIYARYLRAKGHHVLHAMGFDAFGLPAEQFAVQTGTHPRVTTENNIRTMRSQLRRLGLAHDPHRSVATTDVSFYRWTQWIFLQIYNAWYDPDADNGTGGKGRARPIGELVAGFESGRRSPAHAEFNPDGRPWGELDEITRRRIVDSHRLAYVAELPVNWCPGLGTVLANEEVTADGRSERGNFPVYKRPLKQWMMRITVYAERLLADLERLAWPEPIKLMQRNWIGRSEGAFIDFPVGAAAEQAGAWFDARRRSGWREDRPEEGDAVRVFTTRPDTLFGATYMVLAPEHPLVDRIVPEAWPDGTREEWKGRFEGRPGSGASPRAMVEAYRRFVEGRSDVQRQESREKTGVFTGAWAINPATGEPIPVFIADYVLMGYGTGAIMAVPAHDERDFEFARAFSIPMRAVLNPPDQWLVEARGEAGAAVDELRARYFDDPAAFREAFTDDSLAANSANSDVSIDGLPTAEAKREIVRWLESVNVGRRTINYKLRDWLFSRQRYWGEPFPIVYDEHGLPVALPEDQLPVELPELEDFSPKASDDPNAEPEPPLARAREWVNVEINGKTYRRETNTMPQWAGSCWYYLRYLDPANEARFVAPEVERYWMLSRKSTGGDGGAVCERFDPAVHHWGGVDLYVGGAEHAVLHLLYARFWHKVLFDLGHVSTPEPFGRLFNQGYIQAYAYTDARGVYVPAEEVEERDGRYFYKGEEVSRSYGKMGKSLKNAIAPDEMCEQFGCDTLRVYEMSMGPLEASKPWNTRDVIGAHRFLQRVWRNLVDEQTGESRVVDEPADDATRRLIHKTIDRVDRDMRRLSFNTAIAALIEFNNALVGRERVPREAAEAMVKMLAPFAPHLGEELWRRLGHDRGVLREPFPEVDPQYLVDDTIQMPVQVMGKLRATITVPAGADEETIKAAALADENVSRHLEGKTIRRVVYVPGKLLNFVAN